MHSTPQKSSLESAYSFLFPKGLIGFPSTHDYALILPPQNAGAPYYLLLKSLEEDPLCFIVVPLDAIGDDVIQEQDLRAAFHDLNLSPADARVFFIATPQRQDQNIYFKVNLRAPLILNIATQQGWQYIFHHQDYPLQHTLPHTSMLV